MAVLPPLPDALGWLYALQDAEFVRSSWKCVDQHTREGLMTVIERISLQEEMSKAPAATARTTTYT